MAPMTHATCTSKRALRHPCLQGNSLYTPAGTMVFILYPKPKEPRKEDINASPVAKRRRRLGKGASVMTGDFEPSLPKQQPESAVEPPGVALHIPVVMEGMVKTLGQQANRRISALSLGLVTASPV
jgi:hypothetical protein